MPKLFNSEFFSVSKSIDLHRCHNAVPAETRSGSSGDISITHSRINATKEKPAVNSAEHQ